jgi:AraC-like DNA-binding protein
LVHHGTRASYGQAVSIHCLICRIKEYLMKASICLSDSFGGAGTMHGSGSIEDGQSCSEMPTVLEIFHSPRPANLAGTANADPHDDLLRVLSEIIRSAMTGNGAYTECFVRHIELALQEYIHSSRTQERPAHTIHSGRLASWQLRKAKALLGLKLEAPAPVAEVAEACRISPPHFSRAFKQSTGLPPHHWVMERRIEHAKWLLINTRALLVQIAQSCGFGVQSHFTRVFTRTVGISPSAWRRAFASPSTEPGQINQPSSSAGNDGDRRRHGLERSTSSRIHG